VVDELLLLVDVTKAALIFREKVSTDFLGLNIDVEVVELKLTDFGRCEIEDLRDDFKELYRGELV